MSQIILRLEKLFHTEAGVSGQISITFLMNCFKLWQMNFFEQNDNNYKAMLSGLQL